MLTYRSVCTQTHLPAPSALLGHTTSRPHRCACAVPQETFCKCEVTVATIKESILLRNTTNICYDKMQIT
jgi:hypothetical protein